MTVLGNYIPADEVIVVFVARKIVDAGTQHHINILIHATGAHTQFILHSVPRIMDYAGSILTYMHKHTPTNISFCKD